MKANTNLIQNNAVTQTNAIDELAQAGGCQDACLESDNIQHTWVLYYMLELF